MRTNESKSNASSNDSSRSNKNKSKTKSTKNKLIRKESYAIGEIVWSHLKGWPAWPCRIEGMIGNRASVHWYNDYRKSNVSISSLTKFWIGFEQNKHKFPKRIDIKTACQEACIEMIKNGVVLSHNQFQAVNGSLNH